MRDCRSDWSSARAVLGVLAMWASLVFPSGRDEPAWGKEPVAGAKRGESSRPRDIPVPRLAAEAEWPVPLPAESLDAAPRPKLQTRPEVKPETRLEAKSKFEVKPEARPVAKLETKTVAKPETKPETKPAATPVGKVGPAAGRIELPSGDQCGGPHRDDLQPVEKPRGDAERGDGERGEPQRGVRGGSDVERVADLRQQRLAEKPRGADKAGGVPRENGQEALPIPLRLLDLFGEQAVPKVEGEGEGDEVMPALQTDDENLLELPEIDTDAGDETIFSDERLADIEDPTPELGPLPGGEKTPFVPVTKLVKEWFGGKKVRQAERNVEEGLKPNLPGLLRRAGGPPQPAAANERLADKPDKIVTKERMVIEPGAAVDQKLAKLMQRAKELIKQNEWKDALDLLQKIAEHPEDSLLRSEDKRWLSIRLEALRLRGQAPPELLQEYEVRYGGLAKQLLAEAKKTSDLRAYGRIMLAYFHTEAGFEAANLLGTHHLDRGEYSLAARCFRLLLEAKAPLTAQPAWKIKTAWALRLSGQGALSTSILDELRATGRSDVELGGQSRKLDQWWETALAKQVQTIPPAGQAEWWMPFGNATRTGSAVGGEPLLLPRWQQPLTLSEPLRSQVDYLVEDLSDQNQLPLVVSTPIMLRGKVAFRTLRGVRVVDVQTGKSLWETEEMVPIEAALSVTIDPNSGMPVDGRAAAIRFRGGVAGGPALFQFQNYGGGGTDYHPLCHLLFRNGNFGSLSSDGKHLFVLEDSTVLSPRQPGQQWWGDNGEMSLPAGNLLTAYDLETGRPRWEIGGNSSGDLFDLPLAGNFFFGPPTYDQGELYIVGERENDVRLFALDPQTGKPLWSQVIATSEAKISQDVGRRWWPAHVAVSQGIIVCPTTVGWMVAVDRTTRSLLWGKRYQERAPRRSDTAFDPNEHTGQMVQQMPLNSRWIPTPPVITGDRVVYTPLDVLGPQGYADGQQPLVCVDLVSGKEYWRKQRGDGLYLAGVFDAKVLIVSRSGVVAYDLGDGRQLWKVASSLPAGQGVAVGEVYYLPLQSGELWAIDLKKGTVSTKTYLPTGTAGLGNLAMYQGTLLSLNHRGLTTFEQRASIQQEIAERKTRNPRDPWAILREAEVGAMHRDLPPALALLRQLPPEEIPAELQDRWQKLRVQLLTSSIRTKPASDDAAQLLGELQSIARTAEDILAVRRLQVERALALKNHQDAFQALLNLSRENSTALVAADDKQQLMVRNDLWVVGRLREIWQQASAEDRAVLDQRLTEMADKLHDASPADQLRFVTLFRSQPQSAPVKRQLVEQYIARKQLLHAERWLFDLMRSPDPAQAALATERLARMLAEVNLPADAGYFYRDLEQRYGKVEKSDKVTWGDYVRELRASGQWPLVFASPAPAPLNTPATNSANPGTNPANPATNPANLGTSPANPAVSAGLQSVVRMERIGVNYSNTYLQDLSDRMQSLPFHRQHYLQLQQIEQRFELVDASNDRVLWSVPLRSKAGVPEGVLAIAQGSGHQLLVSHRGVLHSLSLLDRQVLWTNTPENRPGMQNYPGGANQNPLQPMQAHPNYQFHLSMLTSHGMSMGMGQLATSNIEYTVFMGRRSLTVVDSLTGEVCWTCDGIAPGSVIFGNEESLFVRSPDMSRTLSFRADDGSLLKLNQMEVTVNRAVHFHQGGFVLLDANAPNVASSAAKLLGLGGNPKNANDSSRPKQQLRLWNPLRNENRWAVRIDQGALLSVLNDRYLAILDQGGKFYRLDMHTGQSDELGTLTADDLRNKNEVYSFADNDNVYLIINNGRNQNFYHEGLPFVRIGGGLYAFDPEQKRLRWQQKTTGQNIVLERVNYSPFLVLMTRKLERKARQQYWMLNLLCLDKQTGGRLLDESSGLQSGFRSLTVNRSGRYVELRSHNERVRLTQREVPLPPAATAPPSPDASKPKPAQ